MIDLFVPTDFNLKNIFLKQKYKMKSLKEILSTSIDGYYELSNRTLLRLNYLNIKTLQDLIQYSEKDLLSIPKAGHKTVIEIQNLLKKISKENNCQIFLGKKLNNDEKDQFLNNEKHTQKDEEHTQNDFDSFVDKNITKLLIPINQIDFSVRTSHCLSQAKIKNVGELIIHEEYDLLKTKNFGKTSLKEIINFLDKMSLKLGMILPNWPPKEYDKLIKNYNYEPISKYDYETIKNVLIEKFNEREKTVYNKRFLKGQTLARIGKTLGVSRERVRQIETKLFRKTKNHKNVFRKFLQNERNYIFKKLSQGTKYITFKSLKNFRDLNHLLSVEKDALINFCILSVFENYTNFLDFEFYKTSKSNFILRTRGNNSRVSYQDAWQKEEKKSDNKKIISGVLKLT